MWELEFGTIRDIQVHMNRAARYPDQLHVRLLKTVMMSEES